VNFHSDRIQSRITNIDRVLDSVYSISRTQNEYGIAQWQVLEQVRPIGQNSRNKTLGDRSTVINTWILSPTQPEPELPDFKTAILSIPPTFLQNPCTVTMAKILGGKCPPVQPPEPFLYKFCREMLPSPHKESVGIAGEVRLLLQLPDSERLLSQHHPIPTDREFRSPDIMPIPKIEYSEALLFADRRDPRHCQSRLFCQEMAIPAARSIRPKRDRLG
jgi:hypothetical protein